MLIGLPGSGKSTLAKNYKNAVVVSSDAIRKELYGDEAIQEQPERVFQIMKERTLSFLNEGKDVIYDATNIIRKHRINTLTSLPLGVQKVAIISWAPIEVCVERDAARNRTVGRKVIENMAKKYQPPFYDEGFDEIKFMGLKYSDKEVKKLFKDMEIPHDNPNHSFDIDKHCVAACEYLKGENFELQVAAGYHDIGKPFCKFFDDKGIAHYYGHQNVGAWIVTGMFNSFYIPWLVGNHMEPFFGSKYYNNLPAFLKKEIDKLHEADLAAH
jgi:predicted kinase